MKGKSNEASFFLSHVFAFANSQKGAIRYFLRVCVRYNEHRETQGGTLFPLKKISICSHLRTWKGRGI